MQGRSRTTGRRAARRGRGTVAAAVAAAGGIAPGARIRPIAAYAFDVLRRTAPGARVRPPALPG